MHCFAHRVGCASVLPFLSSAGTVYFGIYFGIVSASHPPSMAPISSRCRRVCVASKAQDLCGERRPPRFACARRAMLAARLRVSHRARVRRLLLLPPRRCRMPVALAAAPRRLGHAAGSSRKARFAFVGWSAPARRRRVSQTFSYFSSRSRPSGPARRRPPAPHTHNRRRSDRSFGNRPGDPGGGGVGDVGFEASTYFRCKLAYDIDGTMTRVAQLNLPDCTVCEKLIWMQSTVPFRTGAQGK